MKIISVIECFDRIKLLLFDWNIIIDLDEFLNPELFDKKFNNLIKNELEHIDLSLDILENRIK